MEKKHAIDIGASNLSRKIEESSHHKPIQSLAESGGRHEYSSKQFYYQLLLSVFSLIHHMETHICWVPKFKGIKVDPVTL